MPDQEQKPLLVDDPDALQEKAVDAAMRAVFGRGHPDPARAAAEREKIREALTAAEKVYEDARQEFVDDQLAKAGLLKMDVSGVDFVMARESAMRMAAASQKLLDGYGAENYVEHTWWDEAREHRYWFLVRREDGKTPHELRQVAEEKLAKIELAVVHILNCAGELDESEHYTIMRDEGCGWCHSSHLADLRLAFKTTA